MNGLLFSLMNGLCDSEKLLLEALEDGDEGRQANKRIETATQAKNEALAKLSQYFKRMEEFAIEAEQLRKHVSRCASIQNTLSMVNAVCFSTFFYLS